MVPYLYGPKVTHTAVWDQSAEPSLAKCSGTSVRVSDGCVQREETEVWLPAPACGQFQLLRMFVKGRIVVLAKLEKHTVQCTSRLSQPDIAVTVSICHCALAVAPAGGYLNKRVESHLR